MEFLKVTHVDKEGGEQDVLVAVTDIADIKRVRLGYANTVINMKSNLGFPHWVKQSFDQIETALKDMGAEVGSC